MGIAERQPPHQVIFINGPRKSGKDTAVKFATQEFINIRHKKFAGSMKRALKEYFAISDALWKDLEQTDSGQLKLTPLPDLFGLSWVEALIWFSEEVMKPKFGSDVFGRVLAREMRQPTSARLTMISDCRFGEEVAAVVAAFGAKNCHVFQLFRDGYTFAGDTGRYLDATDFAPGITWHTINNNFEQDMYRRQICMRVNKILGMDRTFD